MTLATAVHDDSTIPPRKSSGNELLHDAVAESDVRLESLPSDFGDYELLQEIARGGMGVVFLARQKRLNRIVALKMILTGGFATEDEIRRFLAEAESAASLNHPGIVQIFEVGCVQGQHFFSMEFVDGKSLAERLSTGPLKPQEAAQIIANACDAIEFAHSNGIVHRDLKPANVIVDEAGKPHITDFGLARRDNVSLDTEVGELMGTVSYIPPEQASGEVDRVGPLSDIYSLGATLYSLVVGHPPFHSSSVADTIMQVINQEPVPLRKLNSGIPRDMETICEKCLEKSPARRYSSAGSLAEDLRRYLGNEPILARPTSSLTRFTKWTQRNPRVAALAITLMAALVALYVTMLMYNTQLAAERRRAQQSERQALLLMDLRSTLVSRLQERSASNSSILIDRATELGRLCAGASKLAEADSNEAANEQFRQFEKEAGITSRYSDEMIDAQVKAVRIAVSNWEPGESAPGTLSRAVERLVDACNTSWERSADTDGASETVRRLIAANVAQSAQLILTSPDQPACQPAIKRYSLLATGIVPTVGLFHLQKDCLMLLTELKEWKNGPPPSAVIDSAERVRDLALVESTK